MQGTTGQKDGRVAMGGFVGEVGVRTLGSLNKGSLWQMQESPHVCCKSQQGMDSVGFNQGYSGRAKLCKENLNKQQCHICN